MAGVVFRLAAVACVVFAERGRKGVTTILLCQAGWGIEEPQVKPGGGCNAARLNRKTLPLLFIGS